MNINFNTSYGDISFSGNDVEINYELEKESIQNVIQNLKTNFNDYALDKSYGANLDHYIGESIDIRLAENIKTILLENIQKEITVPEHDINIFYIIKDNTIEYRILLEGFSGLRVSFVKDKGFRVE